MFYIVYFVSEAVHHYCLSEFYKTVASSLGTQLSLENNQNPQRFIMVITHLHLKEGQYEKKPVIFDEFPLILLQNLVIFSSNTYSYLLHFVAYMLGAKISLDENNVQYRSFGR